MIRTEIVYEEDDEILVGFALLEEDEHEALGQEIMGTLHYIMEVKLEDEKFIISSQIISISQAEKN